MYGIYGKIYHQYTPVMLAYIPYMDPSWVMAIEHALPIAMLSRVASLRERPASAVLFGEKSGCCGIHPFSLQFHLLWHPSSHRHPQPISRFRVSPAPGKHRKTAEHGTQHPS